MLQKAYKENIPLIGPEGESLKYLALDASMPNEVQVIQRGGTPFHQPVSLALFLALSQWILILPYVNLPFCISRGFTLSIYL
jgi:hypothetical protein